jgi:hypothetical protein
MTASTAYVLLLEVVAFLCIIAALVEIVEWIEGRKK